MLMFAAAGWAKSRLKSKSHAAMDFQQHQLFVIDHVDFVL